MILVVSTAQDGHAGPVLGQLQRMGAQATLLDLSAFPQHLELTMEYGRQSPGRYRLAGADLDLHLATCRVVWWRRPQPFALHAAVAGTVDRAFAFTEGQAAFSGLWLCLNAFWINHPTRDDEASRKVYQLNVAQSVGLRIPQTCVTNSPTVARAFIDSVGVEATVYKAFAGTEEAWRETRVLRRGELAHLDAVRFAPVIFQEYITPGVDLRITVVGEDIFAAAIHVKDTSYPADFRMSMDEARIEPVSLPESICERLRLLMGRLGLVYGAIDMRMTDEGEYVFFEINPAGQWLFVEQATRQPITETLARVMMEKDRA